MKEKDDKFEKILFKYYSDVLDEIMVETMWALKVDVNQGIYKLDSIPFYGPSIATDDEFFAEFDESEQCLTYRRTTKHSGNSIVLVIIMKDGIDKQLIRDEFKNLNCLSEGLNYRFFSMEVLKETNYRLIQRRLDELEKENIIEYSEPWLSEKHRNDIIQN